MLDDGFIRFRKRKGGKQTVFPVDQETVQTLHRFQMIRGDVESDYLFLSIRGGRVTREQIRRSVRKAAVETDIMEQGEKRFHKKFTPHTFRTVFTTQMRRQRMSPYILRYLRGDAHSETMDIYTRVDRDEAREEYLRCVQSLEL
jgi:integrase/recombinase XerD